MPPDSDLEVPVIPSHCPSFTLFSPGNCGCAFLQIDVGRSSWPLDRPFVTLLPATMLMSLVDSKQGKNRSGVRMFKNGKNGTREIAQRAEAYALHARGLRLQHHVLLQILPSVAKKTNKIDNMGKMTRPIISC